MNFFCTIFGHTWVHKSDSPKTSWNVDKDGLQLFAHPDGEVVFYEECARCRERQNERRIQVERVPLVPMTEDAEDSEAAAAS